MAIYSKILLLIFLLVGCKPLEYKPDVGLISSGFANKPELFVKINGSDCIGGCYIIKSFEKVKVVIPARPYPYRVTLFTSANVGFEESRDVPENAGEVTFEFETKELVFNLLGRVYPFDREKDTSLFFEARVRQYDANFLEKSKPYMQNGWLVLGADSLYTCTEIKCYPAKTTGIKQKDLEGNFFWTESYMGRVSYYERI